VFLDRRAFVVGLSTLAFACRKRSLSHITDLDGRAIDPLAAMTSVTALVFVATTCPVSNRYAPEVQRIADAFTPRGVAFYLVYPKDESADAERAHVREYGYRFPALRDPAHELVAAGGVQVTPEVAVFAPPRRLVYSGRIDDRQVSYGTFRPEPTRRDFERALEAALANGTADVPSARAIGCNIPPLP
jgi:hypothetical protein